MEKIYEDFTSNTAFRTHFQSKYKSYLYFEEKFHINK